MRLRAEAALLAVTMVWGATFLAVQYAMTMSGPFFFVGLRFAIAGAIGLVVAGKSLRGTTRTELVAGTAIAALLGAANLGTAMAFGQLAFAATLVWALLRW